MTYLPESQSLFSLDTELPAVRTAHMQKTLKGEDADFTADKHLSGPSNLPFSVHAVFDGHNGNRTSYFCRKHFMDCLVPRLPTGPLPPEADKEAFDNHLSMIRTALHEAFVEVDSLSIAAGCASGSTASVVLITGWLATIANVGDSEVMLQTRSCGYRMLTHNHRILPNSKDEIARMSADGHNVAKISPTLSGPAKDGEMGVGPMRVWPGGLCVSRAIGDADVGPTILASPHITQISIPREGARFVLASDGLWDGLNPRKAAIVMKSKPLRPCVQELVRQALMGSGLTDDTTVLAVDVVPNDVDDFNSIIPKKDQGSKLFACVTPVTTLDDDAVPLRVFAKVDMHTNIDKCRQ